MIKLLAIQETRNWKVLSCINTLQGGFGSDKSNFFIVFQHRTRIYNMANLTNTSLDIAVMDAKDYRCHVHQLICDVFLQYLLLLGGTIGKSK